MLQCTVVTPEQTIYDASAEFITLNLEDGEIGIAAGHTPLIGRLGVGEMRIRQSDHSDRYYVEGGFVEVLNDVVTVLTHKAIPAAEIDAEVARERLKTALARPATNAEALAVRDRAVRQARAQLHIAGRE